MVSHGSLVGCRDVARYVSTQLLPSMYRISPSEVQANRLSILGCGRLRCGEIRALIDNFDVLQSPQRGAGMALNTKAKAQEAVRQLREAILEELKNHPEGLRNSDITANLELQS